MTSGGADSLAPLLYGRVRALNDRPAAADGEFVLCWLQGQRRVPHNLAVAYAVQLADELGKPLVIYEGLRSDHPYASDRFHRFILQGAADNARDAEALGAAYAFFLQTPGSPRGVLLQLAKRAAAAVTDWLPTFIHPAQTKRFAERAACRVEVVDAAGIAPLSAFPKQEVAARTLRPKIHKLLPELLKPVPARHPKAKPPKRFDWPFEPFDPSRMDELISICKIDHTVKPVEPRPGGRKAGLRVLREFIAHRLKGYEADRKEPAADQTSGLSPYLHFGHVGALEVALAVGEAGAPQADRDDFLEELIVRRDLSLNFAARNPRHAQYAAAPEWAQKTLREHESDERPALYTDAELEEARTGDEVWNASQRQLLAEGRIHNYLRMLWAKNILVWSKTPADAHRRIAWLNDKYALDGRDAVSYTNFLWIFGLHDRPFPERPIYGTVRPMTSDSARRKLHLLPYLERWAKS